MEVKTKRKKKPTVPYENNHKIIENVENKKCNTCNEWLPMNEEYFYKNKSSPDGFNTYCKECTKKKSYKWIQNNKEQFKKSRKKYLKGDKYREHLKRRGEFRSNYGKQYRRNNKEKFKEYRLSRSMHKNHNITEEELKCLYEYADYSCMYCGMSEEEHKQKFNQRLHKDHAINDGSDGIENCVLACKSCNSEKHDWDWNEWYAPKNYKYSEENYNKIYEWLNYISKNLFTESK